MAGRRIGYVRVSTFEQNAQRQLDEIPVDRLFIDQASGKDTQRPRLETMLAFIREGDTVVVHSMDRLARNSMTCAAWCSSSPAAALRLSIPYEQ